jgi:hypothetical protein
MPIVPPLGAGVDANFNGRPVTTGAGMSCGQLAATWVFDEG